MVGKTVVAKWFTSIKFPPPGVCAATPRPCRRGLATDRQLALDNPWGGIVPAIHPRGISQRSLRRLRGNFTYERRRSDQVQTQRFHRNTIGRCINRRRRSVCRGAIGTRSAQDVVDSLQQNGYKVILSKIGTVPLDQCDVAAVRPGRAITAIDATGGVREEILSYTTAYVIARC